MTTLSTANVTGSPVSTILGISALTNGLMHSLPGGSFPTTVAGWVGFGASALMGLLGIFGA